MRQIAVFLVLALTAFLGVVKSQQYVPVQVYIPSLAVNQSAPYGGLPNYNSSNSYNTSYGYNNGYNSSQNGGYRPPGSYIGNQYPNYPRFNNSSTAYNETQDGHLFVGQIQLYDRLLFNQVYRKERRWWASRDKIIEYPAAAPAGYTRNEIISAIRVYNQFLDGNTARAAILKGGVGYQYVKIQLESGWNKGFQYLVQIYGH